MATRKIDSPTNQFYQNPPSASNPEHSVTLPRIEDTLSQNEPARIPAPSKPKTSAGAGIALLIPGLLLVLGGIAFAFSSKSAGNFDAFYQQMVIANVMISLGIVILYHSVEAIGKVARRYWRSRG
jgi:hypothetical protein